MVTFVFMKDSVKPIKRSPQLTPLSKDHHEGLLFGWKIRQGLKNGTEIQLIASYVQWFWKNELQEHFREEEQILAPHLPPDNELLKRMMEEHQQIEADVYILENIAEAALLLQLAEAIHDHIRFEERELFPLAEKIIPREELDVIYEQLLRQQAPKPKWEREFWLDK
jgi:hemerythrin-like domain-containing protein